MRIALAAVVFVLSAALAAAAPARPAWAHVRPLSVASADLVARAAERSALVRAQLERLDRSDVIVYVSDTMNGSGDGIRGALEFVSFAAGRRYLLVRIDRWRLAPTEAICLFSHELHHALEVAAAPSVQNSAQMGRLYRVIGWEGEYGRFESIGAQEAGTRVRNELTLATR